MMDRAHSLTTHDHRHLDQQQQQPQQQQHHYDTKPSLGHRQQLSRSLSYSAPSTIPYASQSQENVLSSSLPLSHTKDDQAAYTGLGITSQSADNVTSQGLPAPDSPFAQNLLSSRYTQGQPPTPSFQGLRSSSPASSVWSASASDHGAPSTVSGFIPRLHKYPPSLSQLTRNRMVSDEKYSSLISWNATGTSFYISRVAEFSSTVLPLHFKHNNFSSFVRQLNMFVRECDVIDA